MIVIWIQSYSRLSKLVQHAILEIDLAFIGAFEKIVSLTFEIILDIIVD